MSKKGSMRLENYDYSKCGAYFITMCTKNRKRIFGRATNNQVELSKAGKIAEKYWSEIPDHFNNAELDEYIIMPDHIHGIITITKRISKEKTGGFGNRKPGTLSTIIGSYKSAVTRKLNELRNNSSSSIWQKSYYDRVIRNRMELTRIRAYIEQNPAKWN